MGVGRRAFTEEIDKPTSSVYRLLSSLQNLGMIRRGAKRGSRKFRAARLQQTMPVNVYATGRLNIKPKAWRDIPTLRARRVRRSAASSGARTRRSALRRFSEGGYLRPDCRCSKTLIDARLTRNLLDAQFRTRLEAEEKRIAVGTDLRAC